MQRQRRAGISGRGGKACLGFVEDGEGVLVDFVAKQLPSTATCHSCGNMPDVHAVSWMGNEETRMSYPMWNANTETLDYLGSGGKPFGVPNGSRWVPAHCDAVLRRHFWFWAENYNSTSNLKSAEQLLGMHLTSVGRGCNMILDMSPTPTGLLQENDLVHHLFPVIRR